MSRILCMIPSHAKKKLCNKMKSFTPLLCADLLKLKCWSALKCLAKLKLNTWMRSSRLKELEEGKRCYWPSDWSNNLLLAQPRYCRNEIYIHILYTWSPRLEWMLFTYAFRNDNRDRGKFSLGLGWMLKDVHMHLLVCQHFSCFVNLRPV